jgi:hypothetical protein
VIIDAASEDESKDELSDTSSDEPAIAKIFTADNLCKEGSTL